MAHKRPIEPYRTDHPLFTDEVEMINDYFNCHCEYLTANKTAIRFGTNLG